MAIPGPDDYALGEIENIASCIMLKLRLIVRGSWISTPHGYVQSDKPAAKTRGELRELVQSYVNRVMGMADKCQSTTMESSSPKSEPIRTRRRKSTSRLDLRRKTRSASAKSGLKR
jgi:hypothetical protein